MKRGPVVVGRVASLPANERAWLMQRAGLFGDDGLPLYSFDELEKNLLRSRRIRLRPWSIRRLVAALEPELSRRRAEAYRSAFLART